VRDGRIGKRHFVFWIERAGAIRLSREMISPREAGLKGNLLEKRSPEALPPGNPLRKRLRDSKFYIENISDSL
jgi:hypothetical protein